MLMHASLIEFRMRAATTSTRSVLQISGAGAISISAIKGLDLHQVHAEDHPDQDSLAWILREAGDNENIPNAKNEDF